MSKLGQFQFKAKWWVEGKPRLLGQTNLEAALRTFEAAEARYLSVGSKEILAKLNALAKVLDALNAVELARLATIAKCGSNPLFKEAKAALTAAAGNVAMRRMTLEKSIGPAMKAARAQLEDRVEDDSRAAHGYKAVADSEIPRFRTLLGLLAQERKRLDKLHGSQSNKIIAVRGDKAEVEIAPGIFKAMKEAKEKIQKMWHNEGGKGKDKIDHQYINEHYLSPITEHKLIEKVKSYPLRADVDAFKHCVTTSAAARELCQETWKRITAFKVEWNAGTKESPFQLD